MPVSVINRLANPAAQDLQSNFTRLHLKITKVGHVNDKIVISYDRSVLSYALGLRAIDACQDMGTPRKIWRFAKVCAALPAMFARNGSDPSRASESMRPMAGARSKLGGETAILAAEDPEPAGATGAYAERRRPGWACDSSSGSAFGSKERPGAMGFDPSSNAQSDYHKTAQTIIICDVLINLSKKHCKELH